MEKKMGTTSVGLSVCISNFHPLGIAYSRSFIVTAMGIVTIGGERVVLTLGAYSISLGHRSTGVIPWLCRRDERHITKS